MLSLGLQNLLSPMVLFFVLGLLAIWVKSDLAIPEAIAKCLALYLLMSIGFRGGAEIGHQGFSASLLAAIAAGVILSFLIPIIAYAMLRSGTKLTAIDAAAIAGHYGSISAVTFVAVTGILSQLAIPYDGYLVAVAAAMEAPAIFTAIFLANRNAGRGSEVAPRDFLREVAFNGAIFILLGSFAIGVITGQRGLSLLRPFILDPFTGILCLFLLDMGLVAGRGLKQGWRHLSPTVSVFAVIMPLIGATLAAVMSAMIDLSVGNTAVLMTLAASASYIAAPAAMRLALPAANPALALTLSLGVTFPFNLLVGIPLYIAAASRMAH